MDWSKFESALELGTRAGHLEAQRLAADCARQLSFDLLQFQKELFRWARDYLQQVSAAILQQAGLGHLESVLCSVSWRDKTALFSTSHQWVAVGSAFHHRLRSLHNALNYVARLMIQRTQRLRRAEEPHWDPLLTVLQLAWSADGTGR